MSKAIRLPPEAAAALARGELIQAIKIVREATGLGLKEAKDLVEAYAAHPQRAVAGRVDALREKAAAANLAFPQQVSEALVRGELIEAIKRLREANPQLGLKEAKDAVDAIVGKHPAAGKAQHGARRVPTVVQGDSGRSGWIWVVAILLVAAVWMWMTSGG